MKPLATTTRRVGTPPGRSRVLLILLSGLLCAAGAGLRALGPADGGFEGGFTGIATAGDARIVSRLGILAVPQGANAALLTTAPDSGSEPGDATVSTVTFPAVALPAEAAQLRFQAAFLTDEPTPSRTNDRLSLILRNQTTLAETVVRVLDTFGTYAPAPWTGYTATSGWQSLVVDLSALAGSPDLFAVEFRLEDVGDGRADSAVLLDDVRLGAAGLPIAAAGFDVRQTTVGAEIPVNGLGSTDDGTITDYRWDFGDGATASGPVGAYAYSRNGVFQGSLTVTDNDGNQDTDLFTVVVGPANNPPVFTSAPVTTAAENILYSYTPTADDPELALGDTLSFALTQGPAGMSVNPATGRLAWLPNSASPRSNPVTLTVTDSQGLSGTQSFTLTVSVPKPFIAASDDAGFIYVIESNGDGTWSNYRVEATVGGADWGVAVADFSGDGYLDIIGAAPSGSTMVFYLLVNDGTNHFANRGPIGSAANAGVAYGMTAGDVNHDGRMDVIASGGTSSWIVVGLGRGNGTFSFTSIDTGISSGRHVDIGDINQDGHLDFLRAVYSSGQISYFRGNGTGGFTNMGVVADPGTDPYGVALADFNNDGFLDLVANEGGSGNAFFYAGNGTGAFAAGVAVSGPDVDRHACFDNLDANGDGNQDLVMGDYSGRSLYYVRGNGDGTFQAAVKISTANASANVLGISGPPGPAPVGYPVAVISPNPFFGGLGATVNFDASASTVGGGATTWTADWQFGDGGTASGVTSVSHTYPATEGDYVARLTITDNLGRVAIATSLVRLLGDVPIANAGGPYTFGESYANVGVWTVALNGSGSSDSSGNPLTYAWSFGNGLTEGFSTPYAGNLPAPERWAYSTQVTVAAGQATLVGAGAWSNRYLITKTQYPRVPGQSFRGRLRVTAGGNRHLMWGLKNTNDNPSYEQFYYAIYFDNNAIRIYEDGGHRADVGSFTDGVNYELRIDVKAAGADYYVRQVGAPAWTFLYGSSASTASPLRFGATVHSGTHAFDDISVAAVTSSAANPAGIVYPRAGTYSASLTVTDTVGQTDTDTTPISLVPGTFPVANPGGPYTPGESTANCGQWTVAFSGAGSTDDNAVYRYEWTFGDGGTGTGVAPSHTYAAGGTYTVALTVTDHALQTHTATTTVTTVPGAPPVASAGGPYAVDEHAANAGLWTVNFSAAGSTDDRGICSYAWTFGDSGTATGVAPSHAYAAVGTYTVTVTAKDHALQTHQASTTVTVGVNDPPVAAPAGPYVLDERFALNGRWTGSFDGTGSTDDIGIWTYAWDFGEVSALACDGSGADAVVVPDSPDLRPAQLTVAAWVYPTAFPAWGTVLMKSTNSAWADGYGLLHTSGSNDVRFFVNGYTTSYVKTTLAIGTWAFVAGTFDGSRLRLYVNGDPVDEGSAAPISHSTGVLEIGNGSGGDYPWNGQIDEVSLWNRALTPTEIRQLATQSPLPPVDNLVAFWNFADGTGTDHSGNGHDGTLTGNAAPGRATGTGVTPTHAFTHAGTFPVTLTVTDHGRQARSDGTEVTVLGNEPPVADAGPALVTEVGMPVTLDAGASTDDFGIWRTYWDFDAPSGWDTNGGVLEAGEAIIVGAGGWGDRYLVANTATPRLAGDSYSARLGVAPNTTSNRYVMWGLKDATSSYDYTAFTYAIYFTNGAILVFEQGFNRGQKWTYSEGRSYDVRIDLKSSGATYYMRPEGTTPWTLIYDSTFSNASPLRPGLTVNSGVAVCSDFRGPAGPLPLPPSLRHTDTAVEVVYNTPGTYRPNVTVTDHAWQYDTATTVVSVQAGSPPVADNGGPYLTNEMLPTRLNGRSSRDDFGIRWYDWDFGDGQRQRTRNPWLDHVYPTAGTYLLTLTVTDYAGHTGVDTSSVNVIAAPVVACVPWQVQGGIEVPHDTLSGRQAVLKAACWSKTTPVTYTWDFGDGSATESGTATNLYKIEARHTYTGIEGTPFTARVTVTDAAGRSATDTYPIRIRAPALDVEINMAIDSGLWWLHGRMNRAAFATGIYADTAIDYGYWTQANGYGDTNYKISPTASALQGFHVNGHRETGDVRQDPYVETTGRGMHYLSSALRPIGIDMQTYGDPDTNGNTVGIETSLASDQRVPYELGQAMDAMVASGEAGTYAFTGTPLLMHRTYRDMVADMVDAYAWGQSDYTNAVGGGWRYSWNGDIDNSAAQWGAIGLLAAEEVFNLTVPQWVKDRTNVWMTYSWNGTGFGYSGPGNGNCTTPSGMVQLAFIGARSNDDPGTTADERDPRWASAENYIASQWNTSWWHPNSSLNNRFSYYAYYAFTKAMRVAKPHPVERLKSTGLDWFKDDTNGVARRLINRQLTDGNWPKDSDPGNWVGDDLTTAWSVVMLSPTLFVQPPVADAGESRVWGLDVTLRLDGSRSYHLDPFRAIVRYEWDLDQDGIYDSSSTTDPTLRVTYTPTGLLINGSPGGSAGTTYPPESLPRNLTIALRVTDNNAPAITDVDTVTITLAIPPRPPIAVSGGPYRARVGVPITLDGSTSFDIDPTDFITSWDWDTDGDLVYDDASGETVQVTFNEVGLFNLGLRVTDNAVMNDLNGNGVQDPAERLEGIDFSTVTVVTNSAPILNRSAQLRFTAITEDTADPAGDTIQALLASDPAVPTPATDPDDDPVGIAVTGLSSSGPGTWQFRLEGAPDWTDFGALSLSSATLLPEAARIRFVPLLPYNNGQTGTLTFQAWDHTHGSAGSTGVDVSVAGDDSAFSLASDSIELPVAAVNDAPLLTAGLDLRFTSITEDDTDPPGDTVLDLLSRDPGALDAISDPDVGAVEGIAVTGLTGTPTGTWQFRLVGAPAWTPLGSVGDSAAVLLPSDARLRFLPHPSFNNGQTVLLTFRAWDVTSGAAGAGGADATANGGTTAFSTGSATALLLVTAVNDAPVVDPAANLVLTSITEDDTDPPGDAVAALLGSDAGHPAAVTDPDLEARAGIAVTGLTEGDKGTWQYRLAGSPAWTDFPTVTESAAVLLPTDARVRYLPLLSYNNGHLANLTFRAWDRTSGTAGQSDASTAGAGGTSAFSTVLATATLQILGVNDAPVLEVSAALSAPETTAGNPDPPGFSVASMLTSSAPVDGISDPDTGAVKGIAVTAFQGLREGRWQFRLPADSLWHDAPAVSSAAALLLPPDADLRFLPPPGLAEDQTLTVSFRAWDRTAGSAGATAASTPNGGTTAFSAAAYTFTLLVRAGGEVGDSWWYPSFSWEPVLAGGTATAYGWYHVQVFAADNLAEPYFEANVHGTTMTAAEYFLAAFDGFPGGRWLWRYRAWDPATDTYGPFIPASLTGIPDPAYELDLDYGPAAVPTNLAVTGTAPGIHLLSFLVGNARAYEVRIVRAGDGDIRTWRHAFIPGEDPAKQQGTPVTFGLDNPAMDPPEIPRDALSTLAVNLPEPGVYRLYVRGFNPTDERNGMPPFTEFPTTLTVTTPQLAYAPPAATGMIPGGGDLIAIPDGAAAMAHRLQWDPMPGAQRFVLYLAAANASPLFNYEDVGSATRLDVALPPGSYTWQVIGLNDEGARPPYGTWSAAQHFEVVHALERPSMLLQVARLSATRIRVTWAAGGTVPDLVEVRHFYSGQHGWVSYAPQALMDVDLVACTGVIEIADLARTGTHHVLLRGYTQTPAGTYRPGQPRAFAVPRLGSETRRSGDRTR